jgi:hypothetical protein
MAMSAQGLIDDSHAELLHYIFYVSDWRNMEVTTPQNQLSEERPSCCIDLAACNKLIEFVAIWGLVLMVNKMYVIEHEKEPTDSTQ